MKPYFRVYYCETYFGKVWQEVPGRTEWIGEGEEILCGYSVPLQTTEARCSPTS